MSGTICVVPPPGVTPETLEQLSTHPGDAIVIPVEPGGLNRFMHRAEPLLRSGRFVIAIFADVADADELDRRLAIARAAWRGRLN